MLGLVDLEVYKSIFTINTKNNKFELYTDTFDKLSFEREEVLNISDITLHHLQHEKIGPCIIQAYRKLRSEKSSTDGYIILFMGYARSPLRDFESFLRIVVSSDEDNIQLILNQYNSNFVTYQLTPGI